MSEITLNSIPIRSFCLWELIEVSVLVKDVGSIEKTSSQRNTMLLSDFLVQSFASMCAIGHPLDLAL